jgi:hypothetical protein
MALAEASALLDHLGPGDVAYAVPTQLPAHTPLQTDELPNHARDAAVHFLGDGFVLARTVENGITLELRHILTVDHRDVSPPVAFIFPDVLVHGIAITDDFTRDTIEILVLAQSGYLFRLWFPRIAPFSHEIASDYSHEYKVDALQGKKPVLLHAVDGQNVVVGCSDGAAFHIEYDGDAPDLSSQCFHLLACC